MQYLINIFIFLLCIPSLAGIETKGGLSIIGQWKFSSFIYQETERPPLNPNLHIYYEFYETGTSRLWWYRSDESGFCERIGKFVFENNKLSDHIVWVNDDNNVDCSKDPDMQLGKKSLTPAEIIDQKLNIHLNLGDNPITYVWQKQEATTKLHP